MSPEEIVCSYSDETLHGIVRQLSVSGDWPQRLRAVKRELQRRKSKRRP
jgi:hypothetical protein